MFPGPFVLYAPFQSCSAMLHVDSNSSSTIPTYPSPLVIQQATVQWVKGLEFGLVFEHLHPRETHRLQRLLDAILGSRSYRDLPAESPNVKTGLPAA